MNKKARLEAEIVKLSQADKFNAAVTEWRLMDVKQSNKPECCLCGHYPILNICYLTNVQNGKKAEIGNCCVKRFLDIPSDAIFRSIKTVRGDIEKSCNSELLTMALEKEIISDWEFLFLTDTQKKRKLSSKQMAIRMKLNKKILDGINKS